MQNSLRRRWCYRRRRSGFWIDFSDFSWAGSVNIKPLHIRNRTHWAPIPIDAGYAGTASLQMHPRLSVHAPDALTLTCNSRITIAWNCTSPIYSTVDFPMSRTSQYPSWATMLSVMWSRWNRRPMIWTCHPWIFDALGAQIRMMFERQRCTPLELYFMTGWCARWWFWWRWAFPFWLRHPWAFYGKVPNSNWPCLAPL